MNKEFCCDCNVIHEDVANDAISKMILIMNKNTGIDNVYIFVISDSQVTILYVKYARDATRVIILKTLCVHAFFFFFFFLGLSKNSLFSSNSLFSLFILSPILII